MPHSPESRRPKLAYSPQMEGLETRLALSTVSAPPIQLTALRTADSKSVTLDYDISTPNLTPTLTFVVYRSADATFDSADVGVAALTVSTTSLGRSTLDAGGQNLAAVGHHSLTIDVPGGLTIEPARPFVLVVANPESAIGAADQAARTAALRTHTIAVVTHGGIQARADDKTGPKWQRKMTQAVAQQGYDSVIKYVWASESRTPGRAHSQGPKLGRMINRAAAEMPAGDPVNIHFIGHSEGVVINSRAAQLLQRKQDPGIAAGYIKMTLLDPHAATNKVKGPQYSVKGGITGSIAQSTIKAYQWQADDPVPTVPLNVDTAEVFWQHTRVEAAHTNDGVYNLWGQVPVRGNARYYDLTGPGISHSGKFGVANWYTHNVVPTLKGGGHFTDPTRLTGSRVLAAADVSTKWYSNAKTARPEFTGTAPPEASLTLFAARSGSFSWRRVGETTVDAAGNWRVASRPLDSGRYRFAARAGVEAFPNRPGVQVTPRLRLGSVAVRAPRVSNRV